MWTFFQHGKGESPRAAAKPPDIQQQGSPLPLPHLPDDIWIQIFRSLQDYEWNDISQDDDGDDMSSIHGSDGSDGSEGIGSGSGSGSGSGNGNDLSHQHCPYVGVNGLAHNKRDTACLVPLMRVCKRFHNLAARILYQHPDGVCAGITQFFYGIDHTPTGGRLSKLEELKLAKTLELVYPTALVRRVERGRLHAFFNTDKGTSTPSADRYTYTYTNVYSPAHYTSQSTVGLLSSQRNRLPNRIRGKDSACSLLPNLEILELSEVFPCQPPHGRCDRFYKVGARLDWRIQQSSSDQLPSTTTATTITTTTAPDGRACTPPMPIGANPVEIGPHNSLAPDLALELCQLVRPHHVCRHRRWNEYVYRATPVKSSPSTSPSPLPYTSTLTSCHGLESVTYASLIMGWDIDDSLPLPLMVGATSILLADWRHLNPYVRSRWPRYVIASNMLRRLRKAYERATTSLNAAAPAAARRSRPENSSSISESITTDLEWEIGSDTETTPTKIIIRLPLPIEDARRAISLLRPFNLKSFAASSTRDNTTATATATAILDDLAQYLQGTTDSQAARLEVELVDDPKPCPICGESWVEDQFGRANHS